MTRDELRDLIVEAKELIPKLERAWRFLEDADIQELTEIQHLPCDACEEEEDESTTKEECEGEAE